MQAVVACSGLLYSKSGFTDMLGCRARRYGRCRLGRSSGYGYPTSMASVCGTPTLGWPKFSWTSQPSTTPSGWQCFTASMRPACSPCCGGPCNLSSIPSQGRKCAFYRTPLWLLRCTAWAHCVLAAVMLTVGGGCGGPACYAAIAETARMSFEIACLHDRGWQAWTSTEPWCPSSLQ